MKPLFSRADLLRIAHELGDDARTSIAASHGFEREKPEAREPPPETPPPPADAPPPVIPHGDEQPLHPSPLWQPRAIEFHGIEATHERARRANADAEAAERAGHGRGSTAAPPTIPPLSPWRRLGPLLHAALTAERAGRRIDLPRLVRHIAEGRQIARVPRILHRAWTPLEVLVDRPLRLAPFWDDQARVVHELDRILGRQAVALRVLANGPGRETDEASGRRRLARGVPVLALTDLGLYAGDDERASWLRLGRELSAAGERAAALVPVPRARWTTAAARLWRMLPWERPAAGAGSVDTGSRAERIQRLLDHLAPAMRIEPGLVRTIRRLLPRAEADVAVEADLWMHDVLGDMYPEYRVIAAGELEGLRSRFAAKVSPEDQARVVAALRTWHWQRDLLPEAWHLEALTLEKTLGEPAARAAGITRHDSERARGFMRWLVRDTHAAADDEGEADTLRRWCAFLRDHAPRALWDPSTAAGEALQTIAFRVGGVAVPNADPRLRESVTDDPPPPPRELLLLQVASALHPAEAAGPARGSPLATLELARPRITLASQSVPESTLDLTRADARLSAPPRGRIELRTDRSTLALEPLTKPTWARAIGRDRFGLWAELLFKRDKADPGVPYRMRWIPPGRFLMGSPADEPGRFDNEGPQHPVVITRGYWLGETPVTQALWQAVTGENPSEFKTPDRPVENVTWNQCRDLFIARLNGTIAADRGEAFRLPTEAEWEYACRAGTTTATYAGPIEIRGKNDAPILDDIAWYGGNSGVDFDLQNGVDSRGWPKKQHPHTKAGTRRVAQKLPNPWGLYDMLGNVYEWCSDWFQSDYYGAGSRASRSSASSSSSSATQQDPTGPATGVLRVHRGGSWDDDAWFVRAAFRYHFRPGYRNRNLGLRLARGQVRQDPAGPEGPGDPEGR